MGSNFFKTTSTCRRHATIGSGRPRASDGAAPQQWRSDAQLTFIGVNRTFNVLGSTRSNKSKSHTKVEPDMRGMDTLSWRRSSQELGKTKHKEGTQTAHRGGKAEGTQREHRGKVRREECTAMCGGSMSLSEGKGNAARPLTLRAVALNLASL